MADNILVTPGSGATISAEDVGSGVLVQRVKPTLGVAGTAVDIVGGSGVVGTGVQRVTLATDVALPAGTNLLGKVGIDQTTPGTTNLIATSADGTIAAGTAPAKSLIAGGIYNSVRLTLTNGQGSALQFDSDGSLYTNVCDWTVTNTTLLGRVGVSDGTNAVAIKAASTAAATTDPALVVAISPNNIPTVASAPTTGVVYSGSTALTPKFATVVASASGATTIVAAVTSKKLRVLAVEIISSGTVNVKWQSHVTPTDLSGLAYLVANAGYVLPFSPVGWFETVAGEALDINLSAAIAVGGSVVYIEV